MDAARARLHHGGTEARRILGRVGLAGLMCVFMLGVQDSKISAGKKSSSADKPEIVPITEEHHHHLVLENEYVRVFQVEVAPHEETKFHRHDMDYVFVTLGDSVVENDRVGEKPVKLELKDGQTVFVKGGFAHKAVNLSDKAFVNYTIELKNPLIGLKSRDDTAEIPCDAKTAKDPAAKCFTGSGSFLSGDCDHCACQTCFEGEGLFAGKGLEINSIVIDKKGKGKFWSSVEPSEGHLLVALTDVVLGEGKSHWVKEGTKSIDSFPSAKKKTLKAGEMVWVSDADYEVYQSSTKKSRIIVFEFKPSDKATQPRAAVPQR